MSLSNEEKKEMREMGEDELGGKLRECLNDKKYLVAMDDVWSIEAWSSLSSYLPESRNGSKALVYVLPIMDDDESWELFLKKTFGARDNTHVSLSKTLEELGRKIEAYCRRKRRQNHHGRECLQSCFLYVVFSRRLEIKASKLIHLWIAEGFVQRRGKEKLEDIVAQKKANGRVMSCRIHDLLRTLLFQRPRCKTFEELRHLNCRYGEISSQFKLNKCMINGYLGVEQLTNLQTLALRKEFYKTKTLLNRVGLKWQENIVEDKTLIPGLMSFSRHTYLYKVFLQGKVNRLPEQTEFYPPNLLEKLELRTRGEELIEEVRKQREKSGIEFVSSRP
ncbi:hypothetical protein AAG906_015369 [Vitis piasezkii]